jgi:hypothetical protein
MSVKLYSDEQLRTLINLRQRYEVWIEAERQRAALPYDLRRKTISGSDYLYEIFDRGGNGRSLGRFDDDAEARLAAYRQTKEETKDRIAQSGAVLGETARLARALRLPLLASEAGGILREIDRRSLFGTHLLVVGTNAMVAYAIEAAGGLIDAPDETEDFDLAWASQGVGTNANVLWDLLKAVDPTFTVNMERTFQARNSKAYEVEILVAPSRASSLHSLDQPKPVALPEQEWLVLGRPIDQVAACRDGTAARLVVPDPRWFALHKLWLSEKNTRSALKRPKDRKQGIALLNAVADTMPLYPLDDAFEADLPGDLRPYFTAWRKSRTS